VTSGLTGHHIGLAAAAARGGWLVRSGWQARSGCAQLLRLIWRPHSVGMPRCNLLYLSA
jgi:hypothetical protein